MCANVYNGLLMWVDLSVLHLLALSCWPTVTDSGLWLESLVFLFFFRVVGVFMFRTITNGLVFVEGCLMVVGWMYFYTCNEPVCRHSKSRLPKMDGGFVRAFTHTRVVVVGGGSNKMVFCIFTRFFFGSENGSGLVHLVLKVDDEQHKNKKGKIKNISLKCVFIQK